MPPSASATSTQLRQLVYYQLDNNLYKNALFLAQRLVAHEGSRNADAAYLLAYCQFQAGYTKASWDTSKPFVTKGQHLGCCYVFAQACLDLGRFLEGLQALDRGRLLWQNRNSWNQHSESRRQHLPDAAAILCLKGKLWKGHKNLNEAVQCWVACLQRNPFMWDAYTLLVESGAQISVPNIYKMSSDMVNMIHSQHVARDPPQEKQPSITSSTQPPMNATSMPDPFVSTQKPTSVLYEKLNTSKLNINAANNIHDDEMMTTPSTVVELEDSMMQHLNGNARNEAPAAPLRRPRNAIESQSDQQSKLKPTSTRAKTRLKTTSEEPQHEPPPPGPPSKRTVSGQVAISQEPVRRTTRSQTSRPPSVASTNKMSSIANSLGLRQERDIKKAKAPVLKPRTATTATVGRAVSGNRMKTIASAEPPNGEPEPGQRDQRMPAAPAVSSAIEGSTRQENLAEKDIEAVRALLDLFCRLAQAHDFLQRYECANAIKAYNSLPSNHRETPFVLAQLGKAYNEIAQYAEAEKYFIRVRQLAPSRLEDMEIYSTVLYQLRSEIELAYLAHELVEIERNSPQTWIAIGNSFSLQREHEQALKCFRRATQLDPSFAYGFTLQGHEHIENEEFEKALNAYRAAIGVDQRHYNAWYGLGKCYVKLGKFSAAESHYRTAVSINGSNAVLLCALGTVVEKTKPMEQALKYYSRACELAPKSALSRFKKARCLMNLGRPEDALVELEILKDIAPDEANVWFLTGRLCKMLGRKAEAVRAFTVALNLDPKAAQFIKDAMETLDEEEDLGDPDGDEDMS